MLRDFLVLQVKFNRLNGNTEKKIFNSDRRRNGRTKKYKYW